MDQKGVTCRIADGRELVLRELRGEADLDALLAFFGRLPPEVTNALWYDVHDRELVAARLRQVDGKNHWRLVADLAGEIVGTGVLDREPFGWTRHIAVLRVVVDPAFDRLGVREALCDRLADLARRGGVERLSTELLAEHRAVRSFLESVGFVHEVTRKAYARGVDGKMHDVVIMSNDLESVWQKLEDTLHDMDVSFGRFGGE
jgi:GNAT superfamily N-acetyltransferase